MSLPTFQLIVLVAAGSLVLGSGATWLYMRIHQLLAEISGLTERLAKLEAASRKRMPYEAMDELLDAMAVLDRMRDGRALELDFLDNGLAHIKKAIQTGTSAARETKEKA